MKLKNILTKINNLNLVKFLKPYVLKIFYFFKPYYIDLKSHLLHLVGLIISEIKGTRRKYYKIALIILILYTIYKLLIGQIGAYFQAGGLPVKVETGKAITMEISEDLQTTGNLLARESIIATTEITGIVKDIYFQEGSIVKKGDPLVKIEDINYGAALEQAKADQELTRVTYERSEELAKKNVLSRQSLDEARANYKKAKAALTTAQENYDKTLINAPFDGIVGLRNVSVGQYVTPGTQVTNVENIYDMEADFRLTEEYLPKLKSGMNIIIKNGAYPDKEFKGKISAIDPRINKSDRTIYLRAKVENKEGLLRSGGYADIMVPVNIHKAIMVPELSLVKTASDNIVYVIDHSKNLQETLDDFNQNRNLRAKIFDKVFLKANENTTFGLKQVKVKIGLRKDDYVEIMSDINENDEVVVAGHQKIRPGALAEITPPQKEAEKK